MHRYAIPAPYASSADAGPGVDAPLDRRLRIEAALYAVDRVDGDPLIGDIFAAHIEGEIYSVRTWAGAVASAADVGGDDAIATLERLRRAYQAARSRQCAAELAHVADRMRRRAEVEPLTEPERRTALHDAAECEAVALEQLDQAAALEQLLDDPSTATGLEVRIRHGEQRARLRVAEFERAQRRGATFSRSHPWLTRRPPRAVGRPARRPRECGRGRRATRVRSARSDSRGDPDPGEPDPPQRRDLHRAACCARRAR